MELEKGELAASVQWSIRSDQTRSKNEDITGRKLLQVKGQATRQTGNDRTPTFAERAINRFNQRQLGPVKNRWSDKVCPGRCALLAQQRGELLRRTAENLRRKFRHKIEEVIPAVENLVAPLGLGEQLGVTGTLLRDDERGDKGLFVILHYSNMAQAKIGL